MSKAPLFFHISPDHCGETDLAELLQANGLNAVCHGKGELAEDLFWSQATDTVPFAKWPETHLFSGLYRYHPFWRPPLDGWRQFATLDRLFPDAYFILTRRDIDAWLLDRLTAKNNLIAQNYKYHFQGHLDLDELELAERWEQEMLAHIDAVRDYFKDDPRLIQVDMETESPADLGQRLAKLLALKEMPGPAQWSHEISTREKALLRILDDEENPPHPDDEIFVDDVVKFCLRDLNPDPNGKMRGFSELFCIWDGNTEFLDANGKPHRLRLVPGSGEGPDYVISPNGDFSKTFRTEAVVNDLLRLNRRFSVAIDMQDARWLGRKGGPPFSRPVLAYNRREDAENIVLWPLHEIHGPGNTGYTVETTDKIPFEEKKDQVVWRGMISGFEVKEDGERGVGALGNLQKLIKAGDNLAAQNEAWENLCRTSRMSVIRRWFGKPDFDLGIVLAWRFRDYATHPLLAPYCGPRRKLPFFHQFRYQLSLAGHDTGSNFIPMINSQSVLFKEEDGWEVYYSGRFKPWVHYIPLERNCGDLPEKLEWARSHPQECKEMSRLARAEVSRFANPHLHRQIKERILDGLAGRGKT